MTRLIDADAIEFPDANYWEETHEDEDYGYGMGVGDCIEIIEKMPTIDAEPVRHGKWTVTPIYIKCSECGESFMLFPQNYCPYCGADMRGEEEWTK